MTRPLDDIGALFASLGMAGYPYRTFPAPPAAVLRPAERDGTDRRLAPPSTRRRGRDRPDVRRPENPGCSAPRRRVPGGEPKLRVSAPALLPIP